MAGAALAAQAFAIRAGWHWQTIVFNVLCLSQMGNVLSISAGQRSFFKTGGLSNPWLLGSVLLTCALQAALTYIPALQTVFHTQSLGLMEILAVSMGASVTFVVMELVKLTSTRSIPE
jgi:Ca2+-transporting ATPase